VECDFGAACNVSKSGNEKIFPHIFLLSLMMRGVRHEGKKIIWAALAVVSLVAMRRMLQDNKLTGGLPEQWSVFTRVSTM
jgi:hypothetical protein